MTNVLKPLLNLLLIAAIFVGLGGCASGRLPLAESSPWKILEIETDSNPLDIAFVDSENGFLVGTNRLIRETNDGGVSWNLRTLDLPDEENFRLISIDFDGEEGWIAGQPGLVLHSTDAGFPVPEPSR